MIKEKLFIALTLLFTSTFTLAAFDGPGADIQTRTVKEAGKAKDDTQILFEGYLIKQLGDGHYLFKDLTGEIEVEIDEDVFHDRYINPSTKIRIHGEVDKSFFSGRTVDVDRLDIID